MPRSSPSSPPSEAGHYQEIEDDGSPDDRWQGRSGSDSDWDARRSARTPNTKKRRIRASDAEKSPAERASRSRSRSASPIRSQTAVKRNEKSSHGERNERRHNRGRHRNDPRQREQDRRREPRGGSYRGAVIIGGPSRIPPNFQPYIGRSLPPPGRSKRPFEGFIFGCNGQTFEPCMHMQLFGGPRKLLPLVEQITPHDTPLFLFHHTNRTLYGVFEATSRGQENIDPHAWTRRDAQTTFPAQVRFRYKYKFAHPLPEAGWAQLVTYHQNKPAPVLTGVQARMLIQAFAENDAMTAHRAAQQLTRFFNL